MDLNKKYPLEFCIKDISKVGFGGYSYKNDEGEELWIVQLESDSSLSFNMILLESIIKKMGYEIVKYDEYYTDDDPTFTYVDAYTTIPLEVYMDIADNDEVD